MYKNCLRYKRESSCCIYESMTYKLQSYFSFIYIYGDDVNYIGVVAVGVMLLVIVVRLWLVVMSVVMVGRDVGRGLVGRGRAWCRGCGRVGGSGQARCR